MIPGRIRRFCQGLRREAGSTTLDILTALAMTLTLAAIVVPSVSSQVRNARANALIGDIETIRNNLIKFFSNTQQMPIILDTALIITNRPGAEKINGVKGMTSGLFVNDKPITLWQGSYIEKEIAFNPFSGELLPGLFYRGYYQPGGAGHQRRTGGYKRPSG